MRGSASASSFVFLLFFFNDTATTEIYTLSLHDALPISPASAAGPTRSASSPRSCPTRARSEEHTSELQSRQYLVCRLLLEKKKKTETQTMMHTLTLCAWRLNRPPCLQ